MTLNVYRTPDNSYNYEPRTPQLLLYSEKVEGIRYQADVAPITAQVATKEHIMAVKNGEIQGKSFNNIPTDGYSLAEYIDWSYIGIYVADAENRFYLGYFNSYRFETDGLNTSKIGYSTINRDGYTFCGWLVSGGSKNTVITTGNTDRDWYLITQKTITVFVTPSSPTSEYLGTVNSSENDSASFAMPHYSLTATAIWIPAEYGQQIIHYFPDADNHYQTELVAGIINNSASESDYRMDSDGYVYMATIDWPISISESGKSGGILIARIADKLNTSKTSYSIDDYIENRTGYSYLDTQITTKSGAVYTKHSGESYDAEYGEKIEYFYTADNYDIAVWKKATDTL